MRIKPRVRLGNHALIGRAQPLPSFALLTAAPVLYAHKAPRRPTPGCPDSRPPVKSVPPRARLPGRPALPLLLTPCSQAMITIYHNPRCSKSRATCDLVAANNATNEPVEVIEYLKTPLTVHQLKSLHALLGGSLRDMMRTNETEYTDLGLGEGGVTDDQLYEAISKHPILLQRPIVVRRGRAVIGRPPENVAALFA